MSRAFPALAALAALLLLTACGDTAKAPEDQTTGAAPTLPSPTKSLIPTVNIAKAQGWPEGVKPTPAAGLEVKAFAAGLDHPRWVYVLPNGDVLVAEAQAPPKPEENKGGLRNWIMGLVMADAGSGSRPSANRITLLRDADGDGVAEMRTAFLQNQFSPFGMALVGDRFFVANADAVVSFPYQTGATQIQVPPTKVADLPAGLNHHWTKSLVASADGTKLYVGVGSNSNVGENGLDIELNRAAILEIDVASGASRVYASGLRNPVGIAWHPETGVLWAVVNERDELGSDLVPDYLTSVRPGGFYGWPYSYYGQHVDDRVKPQNPALVASAIVPDYALGNHVAPLGLAFGAGTLLPDSLRNGAFIGEHGSWNRKPRSGYEVVFVPFSSGKPSGKPVDVLTGFISPEDKAWGRPVGVAIDSAGALLVVDDVGNAVWRVTPATRTAVAQ